jgi:hypothetical protein
MTTRRKSTPVTMEYRASLQGLVATCTHDLTPAQGVVDLGKTRYAHYFTLNNTGNWERSFHQASAALHTALLTGTFLYEVSTRRVFKVEEKAKVTS